MSHKIFLTGFMGSGKSRLGKRIAAESGWELLDTDREIERRSGMTIPEIFERHGEAWFRALEQQVVEDAAAFEKNTIISLGGGAVCRDGAMEALANAGTTVYLKLSPENLVARIGSKGRAKRPKIAGMNDAELLNFIEKTLPEREKYYNKATFVVDCDALSDDAVAELLLQQIESEKR